MLFQNHNFNKFLIINDKANNFAPNTFISIKQTFISLLSIFVLLCKRSLFNQFCFYPFQMFGLKINFREFLNIFDVEMSIQIGS